jgi:alkaline phosphatase D
MWPAKFEMVSPGGYFGPVVAPADPISRRSVLSGGLVLATGAVISGVSGTGGANGAIRSDPFTLGVASGDPSARGFVLWTRLATDPLAEDGLGGLSASSVRVDWQLAKDERFRHIVRSGRFTTTPYRGYAVHVELRGLQPAATYFYRFRCNGYLSPTGRTRTAPLPGSKAPMSMAFTSCAMWEHGWFTAYRHLAQEDPDLILNLGDYIYEYGPGGYVAPSGIVRLFAGPQTTTLAGYRQRYAQYHTDRDLQAAHAVAPWVVVLDDHEVENNWAGDSSSEGESEQQFMRRRAAAFRAYYENLPLRRSSIPDGPDMQLYRRIRWGDLATFHMLDTRQFRDKQPCPGGPPVDCPDRWLPNRTITGTRQEAWLLNGLSRSPTIWNILGNQVFFSQRDLFDGPRVVYGRDGWDGYAVERNRIVARMQQLNVRNPVILTGDVHKHFACNVLRNFDDPGSATVATELVGTSITSNGDGGGRSLEYLVAQVASNPWIVYADDRRGYVMTHIHPDHMDVAYRVVQYVSRRGAPLQTGARFVVLDGLPGLDLA